MSINGYFPYKWDGEPKVNSLLEALLKKDYKNARQLMIKGMKLEDIEEYTFSRVLYEFIEDYEMMKFLVENGFNVFHFPYLRFCRNENNHTWGIVARAYSVNRNVIELLFKGGFGVFEHGLYWIGSDENPPHQALWRWAFFEKKDKELVDLMLSYGTPADDILYKILDDVDKPWYNLTIYNYVKSNPQIKWKGYSLRPRWDEEIAKPEEPYIGIFTSKSKKELLQKRYSEQMQDYENRKRVQREFIQSITSEEWELIKERDQTKKWASEYFSKIVAKR